jgi:hypothetical protein
LRHSPHWRDQQTFWEARLLMSVTTTKTRTSKSVPLRFEHQQSK